MGSEYSWYLADLPFHVLTAKEKKIHRNVLSESWTPTLNNSLKHRY